MHLKTLRLKIIKYVSNSTGIDPELIKNRIIVKNGSMYLYIKDLTLLDKKKHSFLFYSSFFHRTTKKRLPIVKSVIKKPLLNAFERAIKIFLKDYDVIKT